MSDCHSCEQDFANSGCDFLNYTSPTNISKTIEINGDFAYVLKGYNLQAGQHAVVEVISGYGDGTIATPYIVNGKRMELNKDTSVLVLKNSGRYRVVVVDDAGKDVAPGPLMPTLCAEKAEQSADCCDQGTKQPEPPPPPCPAVTVSLNATVAKRITATVTGGPGTATIQPGGLSLLGNGPFVFDALDDGKQYVVTFVSDCGSKAAASAVTKAAATVYCPSFLYDACDCGEVGYGYRDNALKDPAATVKVTACDGATVMWIYPAAGVTGKVRHEVPYTEDGNTVLGYLANQSDCAPPVSPTTIVNVAAPVVNVSPVNNVTAQNAFAPINNVTLPAPNVVAAEWVGSDAALKITQSDGTTITTAPIPACDN